MKVTCNLVCNFLCCLRRHLTSFLCLGHFPLHVSSNRRLRINDGVSAPGLGCFLQFFLFLLLHQLVLQIFITSTALTKLNPLLHANVVVFIYSIIHALLAIYKCPFGCQIRLKLFPPLTHDLKYFLLPSQIGCFRDIKFSPRNEKYILLLVNYNLIILVRLIRTTCNI